MHPRGLDTEAQHAKYARIYLYKNIINMNYIILIVLVLNTRLSFHDMYPGGLDTKAQYTSQVLVNINDFHAPLLQFAYTMQDICELVLKNKKNIAFVQRLAKVLFNLISFTL